DPTGDDNAESYDRKRDEDLRRWHRQPPNPDNPPHRHPHEKAPSPAPKGAPPEPTGDKPTPPHPSHGTGPPNRMQEPVQRIMRVPESRMSEHRRRGCDNDSDEGAKQSWGAHVFHLSTRWPGLLVTITSTSAAACSMKLVATPFPAVRQKA